MTHAGYALMPMLSSKKSAYENKRHLLITKQKIILTPPHIREAMAPHSEVRVTPSPL